MRSEIVWKFVSRPPSQRWLTYGMAGRLGDLLDAVAGLLLRADEQHGAAAAGEAVGERAAPGASSCLGAAAGR